jgi:hypothetical protein
MQALLTISAAARLCGCHRRTLGRTVHEGGGAMCSACLLLDTSPMAGGPGRTSQALGALPGVRLVAWCRRTHLNTERLPMQGRHSESDACGVVPGLYVASCAAASLSQVRTAITAKEATTRSSQMSAG